MDLGYRLAGEHMVIHCGSRYEWIQVWHVNIATSFEEVFSAGEVYLVSAQNGLANPHA